MGQLISEAAEPMQNIHVDQCAAERTRKGLPSTEIHLCILFEPYCVQYYNVESYIKQNLQVHRKRCVLLRSCQITKKNDCMELPDICRKDCIPVVLSESSKK